MRIIKEVCRTEGRVAIAIRTDTYAKSLAHLLMLFETAQRDFPGLDLKPEEVEVVKYGGQRIRKIMGIEFIAKGEPVPNTYQEVRQFELMLV